MKITLLVSSVCCSCCFGEVLRDPTQPLNFTGQAEDTLQLSSIFIGKNKKFAVINGARVYEGDPVPGRSETRVKKIDSREVIIFDGEANRSLSLAEGFRN